MKSKRVGESQERHVLAGVTKAKLPPSIEWGIVTIAIVLVGWVRFRFREFPLERDEGEYAYMGQLMLQGLAPYKLAYTMKLPGCAIAYALMMKLFGQTPNGIHIGLLFINAISILFIFLLARRWFDSFSGAVAAAAFAIFSTSWTVQGTAAHATHFVVLAMLAGMFFLERALATDHLIQYLLSGSCFGVAFVMKQHGLFFGVFGAVWVLWAGLASVSKKGIIWRLGLFLSGALVPLLLVLVYVIESGVFDVFWFWTVQYATEYATQTAAGSRKSLIIQQFLSLGYSQWSILVLAAIGAIQLFRNKGNRRLSQFLVLFTLFSALSVCPGFYFRQHYFITLIPAIAFLCAAGTQFLTCQGNAPGKPQFWRFAAPVLALLLTLGMQLGYFFAKDPARVFQTIYVENPFVEAKEIAKYIQTHSSPNARVAVFGSEPEIYFYSHRHSATGFIYTYGLAENQPFAARMTRQMIQEIETVRPEYFVYVNVATSWMMGEHSSKEILEWAKRYLQEGHQIVGVIEIEDDSTAEYYWDSLASNHPPKSARFILLFKRIG
jgi:hypothetical protein